MRRRTNKSAKVPNVKLRPAQPPQAGSRTSKLRADESVCLVDESQFGSDDVHQDFTPRPFRGVVLCATGIPDKPTLFKQAVELGAIAVPAFTDRVTHLIATGHGGAKYSCAVERKIPILQPSWITEGYHIWLRGDDVDLQEIATKHRLPVFSDIVLCPSGITDITRRTQIHKLVTSHGGQYVKNLERPVRITHLLCSGEEETDKMRYAEKFNRTGEANPEILLVWEEWFWDSLEFGGRFNEDKYQVRRPRPERKSLAERPTTLIVEDSAPPSSLAESSVNPSRRNDTDDSEEAASVKVLPAVTLQLWESLLKVRGYEISPNGSLARSPTKTRNILAHIGADYPESPTKQDAQSQKKSVIDAFRRANSFADLPGRMSTLGGPRRAKTIPALANGGSGGGSRGGSSQQNPADPGPSSSPQRAPLPPSSRTPTPDGGPPQPFDAAVQPPVEIPDVEMSTEQRPVAAAEQPKQLFLGKVFRALGEASSPSVRDAIEAQGGRIVGEKDVAHIEVDYILVRLVSGSKIYHDEPSPSDRLKYRTECWLERCMFEERIIPPEEHITFRPLELKHSVLGSHRAIISLSGLDQSEVCCVKRLAKALGITVSPNFSRKSTHLLCPSGVGAKFDKAMEWGVPVVNMAWLECVARSGKILSVSGFEVGAGGVVLEPVLPNPTKMDKGKGKAKDDELPSFIDITNSNGHEELPQVCLDFAIPVPTASSSTEPSEPISFGLPTGLLGGTKDLPSAGGSNTLSEIPPDKNHVNPTNAPLHLPLPPSQRSDPSTPQSHRILRQKLADVLPSSRPPIINDNDDDDEQRDDDDFRIPSSKSPSPMKLPGNQDIGRQTVPSSPTKPSPSPTKIPVETTKALQKSITSLLGKRRDSEEDAIGQAANVAGATRAKRPRPQRLKGQSRQASEIRVTTITAAADAVGYSADPFGPYNRNYRHTADELGSLQEGNSYTDDVVGVVYEDPKQREEKQRLMELLGESGNGKEVIDDATKGGSTRRRPSRRKPGF